MNSKLLHIYQQSNPEKFNHEFLKSKSNEDVLKFVKGIFKSLEVVNSINSDCKIELMEVRLETNEGTFSPIIQQGKKYKSVLESRFNKIIYKMRFEAKDGIHEQEYELLLNKLIDDNFYINEGVRFFPIFQIIDSGTYSIKNGISLKLLLMPITLCKLKEIEIESMSLNKYVGNLFSFNLFNKKINPLLVFLARYGFEGMLKFFSLEKHISITTKNDEDENYEYFKINTVILKVSKDVIDDSFSMDLIVNFIELLENKTTIQNIDNQEFWYKKLGQEYTKNQLSQVEKGRNTLVSVERLMDDTSKELLRIKDSHKENTFTIMRYLMKNFYELFKLDKTSLEHKRVRLIEYYLNPLRTYLSKQMFRLINTPNITLNSLKKIFNNISPMFLIKGIINNKQLRRYYNSTNEINLFGATLKYTLRGPQAIAGAMTPKQRDVQESYVGRISLIASSASDPGVSGTISPFLEHWDYYFTESSTLPDSE